MKLFELKKMLAAHPEKHLRFQLPTGSLVPAHAHVTEIARIEKRFIDCGGTFRTETLCRLQTWLADDTDHRLTAGKLLDIFEKSGALLEDADLETDVEHEAPFISQFPIAAIEPHQQSLIVRLGIKHTACLAPEKCQAPALGKQSFYLPPLAGFTQTKCC